MAAHSSLSLVPAWVPPDQPASAIPSWLREIAAAINQLSESVTALINAPVGTVDWTVGPGLVLDDSTDPDTVSLLVPVTVSLGGTGATTAAAALANLGGAPLLSPAFLGIPTADTAAFGTDTAQLATCAFVDAGDVFLQGQIDDIAGSSGIGTITGVAAGAGLTGGGTSGGVTLALIIPVTVASGGTGATTAGAALANLGGEPSIAAGTTAQYWRGDKSWQVLDKAAVGLSNVDNTADASKPVSTPAQAALDLKAPLLSPVFTGNPQVPTAVPGDNDQSIASTAFVASAITTATGAYLPRVGGSLSGTLAISAPPVALLIGSTVSYNGGSGFARGVQIYTTLGTQFGRHSADTFAPSVSYTKSRHPTVGSHTAVVADDNLMQLASAGSDGTDYRTSAQIMTFVDGAVSAGIVPGRIAFFTTNAAGAQAEKLRITATGLLAFGGAATASRPALKNNTAILQVRLADDSAYASLEAATAAAGTSTNQVATTAFVSSAVGAAAGGPVTVVAPASGSIVTMTGSSLYVNNPATLASLTIRLPASPTDGGFASLGFAHPVTALTVTTSAGTAIPGAPISAYGPGAALYMRNMSGVGWAYWK